MIADLYPPTIGGSERHVQTLAHELTRRGHTVTVATQWRPGLADLEDDAGVRVHRVRGWSRVLGRCYESPAHWFHPPAPDPGTMRALARIVEAECPDVISARGWMIYSYLPVARRLGVPVVVTLHDYALVCPKRNLLFREQSVCSGPGAAKCLGCASARLGVMKGAALTTGLAISRRWHDVPHRYVAVGSTVQSLSRGRWGTNVTVDLIPSFVPDLDPGWIATLPRPPFVPPSGDYVLFVGQLTRHKGLDVLLEARRIGGWSPPLVLAGTRRPGTPETFGPGVIVVEDVPHEQVMAAWAHCTVGVVPSLYAEPFGQVAVEAMACGRAVVASRTGGLADLVEHGRSGVLVPPGDPTALASAVAELIAAPERRAELGRAARERARMFMVGSVAGRIEALLADVAASPRRPAGASP